jgi:hypothetical protein
MMGSSADCVEKCILSFPVKNGGAGKAMNSQAQ